jgi:putative FmdB family regulatory protein
MPVYDYKCNTCDLTMTVIRSIKDTESNPICVNCAKELSRVYDSAPAVTFKGNGWGKDG